MAATGSSCNLRNLKIAQKQHHSVFCCNHQLLPPASTKMTTSTRSRIAGTNNNNTRKPFGTVTDSSLNHNKKSLMSKNAKNKRSNPSSPARTIASPQKKKKATDAVAAKEASSDASITPMRRTGPSSRPIAAQMVMRPQQQQPVTPDRTQSLLQSPQKGDRFRVFFDRADDAFGKDTVRAQGYFFGTVLEAVTTARAASSRHQEQQQQQQYPKYKLTLQFDSGETPERIDYCPTTATAVIRSEDAPEVTVERLVPSSEHGSSRLLTGEITGDFAADLNPARLDVGDLVFCRYQNNDNGTWYRGRITAVKKDGKSCDIAYDDNEVRT